MGEVTQNLERQRKYELGPGSLAPFAGGLSWRAIHALDVSHGTTWWRCAVADAEQRGLLEWDRMRRVWTLTADGYDAVRDVS